MPTHDPFMPFDPSAASKGPGACTRAGDTVLFSLVELDPRLVVDGVRVSAGLVAEEVIPVGKMRETCTYCLDEALKLVLRYQHVIRSHLFCANCTRCFDANYPDGSSSLTLPALSIN